MHVHVYIYMCLCVYVYMYMCAYACMYVYICVCLCVVCVLYACSYLLLMILTDEADPHHNSLLGVRTIQLTGSVPMRINNGQGGGGS